MFGRPKLTWRYGGTICCSKIVSQNKGITDNEEKEEKAKVRFSIHDGKTEEGRVFFPEDGFQPRTGYLSIWEYSLPHVNIRQVFGSGNGMQSLRCWWVTSILPGRRIMGEKWDPFAGSFGKGSDLSFYIPLVQ